MLCPPADLLFRMVEVLSYRLLVLTGAFNLVETASDAQEGKIRDYAPENIIEAYYFYRLFKGLSISPDYQWVKNPAYNQDRGPVNVFALRFHYEY